MDKETLHNITIDLRNALDSGDIHVRVEEIINRMYNLTRPEEVPPKDWRQFTSGERAIFLDKLKEPQERRSRRAGEDGSMRTDVQRMMISDVEEALEHLSNPDDWCLAKDALAKVCLMLEVASEFQVLAENLHEFLEKEGDGQK